MSNQVLAYLETHWWVVAIAVTVLSTIMTKLIDFYGPGRPRLVKFGRFLLSLLAALPAKGSQTVGLRLGPVAVPLLSWGKEKK